MGLESGDGVLVYFTSCPLTCAWQQHFDLRIFVELPINLQFLHETEYMCEEFENSKSLQNIHVCEYEKVV